MKTIEFSKLEEVNKALITLGNFDGFHQGQVAVLKSLVKRCRELSVPSLVFSFDPHPQLFQTSFLGLIQSQASKNLLFSELGVDFVCYLDFKQIKGLEYYQFLDLVKEKIELKGLVASEKLQFGFLKKGSFSKVREYFDSGMTTVRGGFMELVPCFKKAGEKLSSSMIRQWLVSEDTSQKKFSKINQVLMLPFHLSGVVIKGRQLGRTIGFPTINFEYPLKSTEQISGQIKIPNGSYVTLTYLAGQVGSSVTYVGNPNRAKLTLVETHILNFSGEVYGKTATVFFLNFLGPSEPTANSEEVKVVIGKQKNKGIAYFKAVNKVNLDADIEFIKRILRGL